MKHGATAFVDDSYPTHLLISFKNNVFFGIHLPDLVRRCRAGRLDLGPSAGGCRREVGPSEPSSQRPRRGDCPRWVGSEELGPNEFGPPSGVFAAESEGGVHGLGGRELVPRVCVTGRHTRDAIAAEPLEQPIDGRTREIKPRGDLRGIAPLLPEPKHDLTDWNGDGPWHDGTSPTRTKTRNTSPYYTILMATLYQTRCPE